MRLYLVRHGKALAKEADAERHLAPEGQAEVARMARWAADHHVAPADVWHSPKARARQTAEIMASALGLAATAVREREGLKPNDDVDDVIDALADRDADLLIAGHMPSVSRIASALLADDPDAAVLAFETAAIACLDRDDNGLWTLCWLVGPANL